MVVGTLSKPSRGARSTEVTRSELFALSVSPLGLF